jgi:tetratricopeptide (TPR) repeat protein
MAPVNPPAEPAPSNGAEAADNPLTQTIDQALQDEDPALTAVREQIAAQEFDESIVWLNQQIDLIERVSHRYAPELIEPLTLLGDAHTGKGEHEIALDHYQRATHLSRVNDGLNSASQIPSVYREAASFRAMQDFEEANDREEYAYHVLTKAHGSYDKAILPGVYHLAEWYSQTNNVFSARAMYEHALNILSANGEQQSIAALPAYRGIAASYRLERFPPFYVSGSSDASAMRSQFEPEYVDTVSINNFPSGERALQKIIAIYRENPERYGPQVQIEAILDLADWYLLWDKYSRAHPLYAHAYAMVEEIEGIQPEDVFAAPKLLHFPAPKPPTMPPPRLRGAQQQGVVEITFEVSKNGHVRDMSTVVSQPEGMMDFRVRKSLRMSRYRPVLTGGLPTAHAEHRYQYNFAYFPKVEPEDPVDAE